MLPQEFVTRFDRFFSLISILCKEKRKEVENKLSIVGQTLFLRGSQKNVASKRFS